MFIIHTIQLPLFIYQEASYEISLFVDPPRTRRNDVLQR